MKYSELANKSIAELLEMHATLEKEAMNIRLQKTLAQWQNTARIRVCRRDIARIQTRIHELKAAK